MEDKKQTPDFSEKDKPTQEQMDTLQNAVQKLLNPTGENKNIDGYITSTFGYISGMLDKVAKADDKDAAVQEITDDLQSRFGGWAKEQQAAREARKQEGNKEQ